LEIGSAIGRFNLCVSWTVGKPEEQMGLTLIVTVIRGRKIDVLVCRGIGIRNQWGRDSTSLIGNFSIMSGNVMGKFQRLKLSVTWFIVPIGNERCLNPMGFNLGM
jgi:hypothetical protein